MKQKSRTSHERDRKVTEQKLIDAVGSIIKEEGFARVKINGIAEKAGVSKILIYRYFGDLNGLIIAFMKQKDFWSSYPLPDIKKEELSGFLKKMFRRQVRQMRADKEFKELYRWEISQKNDFTGVIQKPREENGLKIIAMVKKLTKSAHSEVAAIATILSAAITYLVLFEDFGNTYNGIDLRQDKGWNQILKCIDSLIDLWMHSGDRNEK